MFANSSSASARKSDRLIGGADSLGSDIFSIVGASIFSVPFVASSLSSSSSEKSKLTAPVQSFEGVFLFLRRFREDDDPLVFLLEVVVFALDGTDLRRAAGVSCVNVSLEDESCGISLEPLCRSELGV